MINTGTTIVTFLMVFLIQNTQNRDTAALQLKLDELILATKDADNSVARIEDASDTEREAALEDIRERAATPAGRRPGGQNSVRQGIVMSHVSFDSDTRGSAVHSGAITGNDPRKGAGD